MRNIVIVLLIALLSSCQATPPLIGSAQPLNYSLLCSISLNFTATDALFSPDYSQLILYSSSQQTPYVVNPYNWQPLDDLTPYNFSQPTCMEFFVDDQGNKYLLYGNTKGQIRLKHFYEEGIRQTVLFTVPDTDKKLSVKKIVVSQDGLRWAAFCQGGFLVYIAAISQSSVIELCHNTTTAIYDIGWVPGRNELLISGGNFSNKLSYLYQYDVQNKKQTPLDILETPAIVTSFTFSSPSILYALETKQYSDANDDQSKVKKYDFSSKKIITYTLESRADVIRVKDNVLLLKDWTSGRQTVHLLSQQLFTNSSCIFDQQNLLKQSTLSLHGDYIVELSQWGKQYQIYGLCHQSGYFYNSQLQYCSKCQPPCSDCFLNQNRCISCVSNYKLNATSQLCLPIPDNYTVLIIVCIVVGVSVIAIGVVAFRSCWKKAQKKNKERLLSSMVQSTLDQEQNAEYLVE